MQSDQDQWRTARRFLNQHRPQLARLAAHLYEQDQRLDDTGLLTRPEWIPDQPVELSSIDLTYLSEVDPPAITGTEPEARGVRPRAGTSATATPCGTWNTPGCSRTV